MKAELQAFLSELSELSRKHGFAIVEGPPCCRSPAIVEVPMDGRYDLSDEGTHLEWTIGDWN